MSKYGKLRLQILRGTSDSNILFDDLCQLLSRLGFDERVGGSHHVFWRDGIRERINLQKDGDKAKGYQVRQVRDILVNYNLGGNL